MDPGLRTLHLARAVDVTGLGLQLLPAGAVVEVVLRTVHGEELRTFADREGRFALAGVPAGRHMISVYSMQYLYPDVSCRVGRLGWRRQVHGVVHEPDLVPPKLLGQSSCRCLAHCTPR